MKLNRIICAFVGLATLFTGCKEVIDALPTISIDKHEAAVEMTAGTVTVTVTSNYQWEARSDQSWVTISPASGNAAPSGTSVSIMVADNSGEDSQERTAVVTFYGNNSRLVNDAITITQAGRRKAGEAQPSTIADFIKNADKENEYVLTGKVGNISNGSTYYGIYIKDETGEICCPFPTNWDDFKTVVATGGTIKVQGKYSYYDAKSQHQLSNGKLSDFVAPSASDAKTATVKEFVDAADAYSIYRLTGTVASTVDSKYCSFDLKDETGTVKVYSVNNASDWATVLKKDGTVTLRGAYTLYTPSNGGAATPEVVDAYIEDFKEKVIPPVESAKVADIIAATDGAAVTLNEALVVAVSTYGYLVTDGTDHVLVYGSEETVAPKVGDKVKVTGKKGSYKSMAQITEPASTILSSGNAVTEPTAEDITSTFDSFKSTKVTSIKATGIFSITTSTNASGNEVTYYNLAVAGANTQGSIFNPVESLGLTALNGKRVEIEGYYLYSTASGSTNFYSILVTKAAEAAGDFFEVAPTAIEVKADATSATFDITTNLAWTAESKTAGFALDAASGTGNKTVTVSFAANTDTENAKTATIEVTTSLGTKTVTITQKKYVDAGSLVLTSNVTWTAGENAQVDEAAVVNGTEGVKVLKLGTSSNLGKATLKIPAGTKKITYIAVGWKDKTPTAVFKIGETTVKEQKLKANNGATANPPFTLTVTEEDVYTIDFAEALATETVMDLTASVKSNARFIILGINAE